MAEATAKPDNVLVIGGGWAGLAAAIELTRHGIPVTLLEAARQLGGRARCVPFDDVRVDNGQHLMIGAYESMLRLMAAVGVDTDAMFLRQPLDLHMRALEAPELRMRTRKLPAPLNLAWALATLRGLPPRERLQLLRFSVRLVRNRIAVDEDITAQALLLGERQGARVMGALWEPLCLAAMNTPLAEASARLFLEVLRRTFLSEAGHSDLLIPKDDLGVLLPEPALDFIERNGGKVLLNHRVQHLLIGADNVCRGIGWRGGELHAQRVILAVHPVMCRRLLATHPVLGGIAARLAQLRQEPITTVYLRYPEQVAMSGALQGIQDGLGQWIFDRRVAGHPGLIAVVISGRGEHLDLDNAALGARIQAELARLYPDWPAPLALRVIREKRATFAALPGVDALRPTTSTPVAGLWLAGDFTATGLPATLEGAVISGLRAAQAIRLTQNADATPM